MKKPKVMLYNCKLHGANFKKCDAHCTDNCEHTKCITPPAHTPTPLKVTWDGQGINNTDAYASRIAKFQPEYLDLGPSVVRAVNAYEDMLKALKAIYEIVPVTEQNGRALLLVHYAIAQAEGK